MIYSCVFCAGVGKQTGKLTDRLYKSFGRAAAELLSSTSSFNSIGNINSSCQCLPGPVLHNIVEEARTHKTSSYTPPAVTGLVSLCRVLPLTFQVVFFFSLSPHLLLCLFLLAASKSSTRWFQPPASSFVSSTLSVFPSSLLVCGRTGTRLGRWQVLHKRRHITSFAPISDYTHR